MSNCSVQLESQSSERGLKTITHLGCRENGQDDTGDDNYDGLDDGSLGDSIRVTRGHIHYGFEFAQVLIAQPR